MNVLGSFGRYAESQFRKIERWERRNQAIAELLEAIERKGMSDPTSAASFLQENGAAATLGGAKDEVKAVYRSLFDRGLLPQATFDALVRAVAEDDESRSSRLPIDRRTPTTSFDSSTRASTAFGRVSL